MGIQISKLKSANYIIGSIFIFLSTIPWFGVPFLDSQPWPVLAALLFLFINIISSPVNIRFPKMAVGLAGLVVFGLIIGSFMGVQLSFEFYRGIINYISIVIYIIAFYQYFKLYGFPLRILIISNIIWLIIGFVQLFVPDIVSSFVALRTTIGRGVTSLAPEPTYFGIYLFFSSWLILLATKYKPNKKLKILLVCNLLSILLLAKSAMVALFLAIVVFFLILQKMSLSVKSLKAGLAILFIFIIGYISVTNFMPNTRIATLLKLMITIDPVDLIALDASVNARFASVLVPIQGFIYNLGLPGGFVSFEVVSDQILASYGAYFQTSRLDSRIMSWNGALLYELGIFGILIWLILFDKLLNGTKQRRYELIILFIILFSAIPLAFPLIPMIFAVLYYSNCRTSKKLLIVTK